MRESAEPSKKLCTVPCRTSKDQLEVKDGAWAFIVRGPPEQVGGRRELGICRVNCRETWLAERCDICHKGINLARSGIPNIRGYNMAG